MLVPVVGQTYRFRSDAVKYSILENHIGTEMLVTRVTKTPLGYSVYGEGPNPTTGGRYPPNTCYCYDGDFGKRFEPVNRPEELINEDWS